MIGCFLMLALLGAPESENEDSLAGITCVVIAYPEDSVLPAVRNLGKLTPEILKNTVELELRSRGVPIGDGKNPDCDPSTMALLRIHLYLIHGASDGRYVYGSRLHLWELVILERTGQRSTASTWVSSYWMGTSKDRDKVREAILGNLRKMADEFSLAYLRANPKDGRKTGDGK